MTPRQIRKATSPELRKMLSESYISLTPSQWNTRDHREYMLWPKYNRGTTTYLRATWIRFGRNITYEIVEAWANPQGFTERGKVISTGCRTLAEVREAAWMYWHPENKSRKVA